MWSLSAYSPVSLYIHLMWPVNPLTYCSFTISYHLTILCFYVQCFASHIHSLQWRIALRNPLYNRYSNNNSEHCNYVKVKKVKSLFWFHIHAQSSALQTLTSTFPGHWAFTIHIFIWISISTHRGVYSRSHATWRHGLQICPHRYPFAPVSSEAMQREVHCSGAERADAPAGYLTRDLT